MVNGTRTHYNAILVVGIVAGASKCINVTLQVSQSCKEIIGNVVGCCSGRMTDWCLQGLAA
jgi:hypothetical protein